ncbi:hypothetical protein HYPSUDRAFT_50992 [Hypholoma sublateritium FD-334 SS-4]|uniref:Uncharacterized protein n=1 Tax=Hypholoma sublateritium (strain FD-334 SS-4) TaxID=945553 RepID=A0A0D2LLI6_HYPSF|nr:hypothetical protein HYPSUDRAFT_50992 [Hypholoma sublateritium FD-334 SS-4]
MLHVRPSRTGTSEERPYPPTLSVNTSADHLGARESQPFAHDTTPTEGGGFTPDITLNGDDEPSFLNHDEERAIRRLLESWMERLQLISVLTIFFASTEATLISITTPPQGQAANMTMLALAANAGLTGGLVLHILAALISFLGGFFLVRYKIKWARTERQSMAKKRESSHSRGSSQNYTYVVSPVEMEPTVTEHGENLSVPSPPPGLHRRLRRATRAFTGTYLTWNEAYLEPSQIHRVPTRLLGRFHFMCVVLTLLGFIASVIGIVCDAYDRLPPIIGSVALIVMSITFLIVIGIFFMPDECEDRHLEEGGGGT